ncbi:hypothetical protein J7384_18250 [Endozoicomonas sp. G2_1]|uniref:hypothetical protein n=1 Tax=Endozoicomonas sp. G2_1 TaxID=2821091 RepID=UPI001ADBE715|nr:hypothetical protein [Endozoicomonas sp. G2_1]MBO9492309.1 hypothetical protein [Endozoicomonas sp. G2_1]
MKNEFRQAKYQNESGSKIGRWYLNRLDYFEFYSFEGENKLKAKCLVCIIGAFLLIKISPILISLFLAWTIYVSVLTLYILQRKICKYSGYFAFPNRIVEELKSYKKEIDITDFDSLATMESSGISRSVINRKYDHKNASEKSHHND